MICQVCKNNGILNSANGKEFYYCRTCKIEIPLEKPKKDARKLTQREIDAMLDAAASGLVNLDAIDDWSLYFTDGAD